MRPLSPFGQVRLAPILCDSRSIWTRSGSTQIHPDPKPQQLAFVVKVWYGYWAGATGRKLYNLRTASDNKVRP